MVKTNWVDSNIGFSKSLIIHDETTNEISTERRRFGYVIKHLSKVNPSFFSFSSQNTDLFEKLDQTLE